MRSRRGERERTGSGVTRLEPSADDRRTTPRIVPPSASELVGLAARDDIVVTRAEAEELAPVVAHLVDRARAALELPYDYSLPLPGPRDPGYQPSPEENAYNAFIRRCHVTGAADGPLAGRTVAVKDNISVAGVPTTNASRMPPHTPDVDAVVVERILAAGGVIVGKLNMDDMAAAGTGETSAFGPARNPVDPDRSAGGSSGGSGAAVAGGEVDISLGVDQGGSGRIPAAFCGVVTVKATQGLIPSFGVAHIDHTIDSVTPIARSVFEVATMLEVIAGEDWRDPQWVRGPLVADRYTEAAQESVAGMRIGVVTESCDSGICEPAVLAGVDRCVTALADAGASVERVSIPMWADGLTIFQPYIGQLVATMLRSDGEGVGHMGYIDAGRMGAFATARRENSALLAQQVKAWVLADRWLRDRYANCAFAPLHDLRLMLGQEIDAALARFDLLLTPTLPVTAPLLLTREASFAEIAERTSAALCYNTAPLNLSGHPAISHPSGRDADGLPTAVQLIGGRRCERLIFRAAFALEAALTG